MSLLSRESVFAFYCASILLSLAPGPDNIFVLAQSALYGVRRGVIVTLGLCTGLLVHTAAVALGVAAILQVSPRAFWALKICGVFYLLYLAWGAWSSRPSGAETAAPALPYRTLYFRGIIMNVTNPKVLIFFLAFLPQFTDPARGFVTQQIILLGGLFILAAFPVFSLIACASGAISMRLRSTPRWEVRLNRIAAIVFLCIALKLAFG